MIVFKTRLEILEYIQEIQSSESTVGFVPTMGALHKGHISLVEKSVKENDFTVVSIFVNPIQFNNPKDLEKYPRTLETDLKMLENAGCDIVFNPEVDEMYPPNEVISETFDFGNLETVMEGVHRPGHFRGVAIVVKRLFDAVPADNAYFGLKDFQQLAIIQSLVEQKNISVKIHPCAIVREADGLAMSSRNVRLTPQQRVQSVEISKVLMQVKNIDRKQTPEAVKKLVVDTLNNVDLLSVEYFDIVDNKTLQSIKNWTDCKNPVGCIAVNVGEVRLIDNVVFFEK